MKTVGEFREAGYVFSSDDIVDYSVCKDGSDMRPLFGAALHFHISKFNKSLVGSFAWRTNTGVKPEFDGDVEYKLSSGESGVCHITLLGFGAGSVNPLMKWRPHLPTAEEKSPYDVTLLWVERKAMIKGLKPELFYRANSFPAFEAFEAPDEAGFVAKPVYTKEMHEAGERPQPGSVIAMRGAVRVAGDKLYYVGQNPLFECLAVVLDADADGNNRSIYDLNYSYIIPIKTDREKAIDEMVGIYESIDPLTDRDVFEALYDAGYRKEQVK